MSKLWSPLVRELTPYVPGEQPRELDVIKLNTNENPYGPSPRALAAIRTATTDALRLYPDPESRPLVDALARAHGVEANQVFVGNGSDEVLAHVFHALLKHERPVLFPDITYSFYPVYCTLFDIDFERVPLGADFEIVPTSYDRPNGGIIFPNPNAPTGRAISLDDIEGILTRNREALVVVDEAYVAFGTASAIPLIARYENLLVVQTLSKSHGLAGLRVGAAFGDSVLIEALQRIKNSFNSYPLDRLAIAGAVAAIEDRDYYEATRHKLMASRDRLNRALIERGFAVVPSSANFVFVSHPHMAATDIASALRARSIIVRHFEQPRTANYLRITLGTDDELDALLDALTEILA